MRPRTTRTDRESNSKGVQHQGNKNKPSSGPVGGAETGTRVERTRMAVAGPRLVECGTNGAAWAVRALADPAAPHSHIDKPDKRRGVKPTPQPQAPAQGNNASNLGLKAPLGVGAAGETPSLTGEVVGETHRVLECAQAHSGTSTRGAQFDCGYGSERLGSGGE